ncbi:MAG: hypothetical protein ABL966_06420 [Acidimicrobiales bacterium]
MATLRQAVAAICGGGALVVLGALPAAADVVDPTGACGASGEWEAEGVTRASPDFVPDDIIEIPQEDTVRWSGNIAGNELGAEGPRREISGEVDVDIAGIGSATIDDWAGSSVRYANEGEHTYDIPDVLVNVKMRLHGEHREAPEGSGNFTRVCGGSVYLQVKGDTFGNPLAIAALVGMVASGAGLASAGVVRKKWAFEDQNKG